MRWLLTLTPQGWKKFFASVRRKVVAEKKKNELISDYRNWLGNLGIYIPRESIAAWHDHSLTWHHPSMTRTYFNVAPSQHDASLNPGPNRNSGVDPRMSDSFPSKQLTLVEQINRIWPRRPTAHAAFQTKNTLDSNLEHQISFFEIFSLFPSFV